MDTSPVHNWADGERAAMAGEALLMLLSDDSRVKAAYADWRQAHGLDSYLASLSEGETPEGVLAFGESIMRDEAPDREQLTRLITNDLNLPYAPWLSQLLLAQFRAWAYSEARGYKDRGETIAIGLTSRRRPDSTLPAGRRPKGGARNVWRDVEWFYRTEIKSPPESKRAVAREYAVQERRHTDARSVVQEAVQRAKDWLAVLSDIPLPE